MRRRLVAKAAAHRCLAPPHTTTASRRRPVPAPTCEEPSRRRTLGSRWPRKRLPHRLGAPPLKTCTGSSPRTAAAAAASSCSSSDGRRRVPRRHAPPARMRLQPPVTSPPKPPPPL
ncbi:Os03g0178800 [Oryza sativa Japonica Group]|uniref:Os03g0178800 protein n=1 Tax=Oryza sativa subsp. japonica TaxID=39947 RepID=C7IZT0_ORYSJ|nr:Os03g0178800 [Oryza sativa Japonica Group]|eukprot:NP_001173285.1 Os03g0178800 [Oryza sativa Japonica Group]